MEETWVMPIEIITMPFALEMQLLQFIPKTHLHIVGLQKTGTWIKYLTGELIRKALIDTAMEYYAAIKGNSKEVAAGEKDDGSMYWLGNSSWGRGKRKE